MLASFRYRSETHYWVFTTLHICHCFFTVTLPTMYSHALNYDTWISSFISKASLCVVQSSCMFVLTSPFQQKAQRCPVIILYDAQPLYNCITYWTVSPLYLVAFNKLLIPIGENEFHMWCVTCKSISYSVDKVHIPVPHRLMVSLWNRAKTLICNL